MTTSGNTAKYLVPFYSDIGRPSIDPELLIRMLLVADDDSYTCPGGKKLRQFRRAYKTPRSGADKDNTMRYRAKKGIQC